MTSIPTFLRLEHRFDPKNDTQERLNFLTKQMGKSKEKSKEPSAILQNCFKLV